MISMELLAGLQQLQPCFRQAVACNSLGVMMVLLLFRFSCCCGSPSSKVLMVRDKEQLTLT